MEQLISVMPATRTGASEPQRTLQDGDRFLCPSMQCQSRKSWVPISYDEDATGKYPKVGLMCPICHTRYSILM